MIRFQCSTCGEWHEGIPGFSAEAPLYYYSIPEAERTARCDLDANTCIVDHEFFFLRGNIEIPVQGSEEAFVWGVWVSLSRTNFDEYLAHFHSPDRSRLGPYFGWLSANFRVYPDAENLRTMLHPREPAVVPIVELEPTDHLLAVEQRTGINVARVAEIYAAYEH